MKSHKTSQSGHTNGHTETSPPPKKSTQALCRRHPKTSLAYWKLAVERRAARGVESPHYSVRIRHGGKRVSFALGTPDKEVAARLARGIYNDIVKLGWDEAIAQHGSSRSQESSADTTPTKGSTVGELIDLARKLSDVRSQTFQTYARALRRLTSEVEGLSIPKRYYGAEHTRWIALVEAVPLAAITAVKVAAWRQFYINSKGPDILAKKRATVTANSVIRNSKAFFSKRLLPLLAEEFEMPTPLPFEGLSQLNAGSTRYQSNIDPAKILAAADNQLRSSSPQAYLILQLALRCGLRVGEIDHLLWSSVDIDKDLIRVEDTQYHQLKSEDSSGSIDLSPETVETLKAFKSTSSSEFVVESLDPPTHLDKDRRYRCRKSLSILRNWLRMKGVTAKKPIHELRKEVGSVITAEHGILAASRFLRHSNIQITASYYVDAKTKVVPVF